MILINSYERKIIAQRFPNTIAATRHHAYMTEDVQALFLLNKLRHPKPRKQAQK